MSNSNEQMKKTPYTEPRLLISRIKGGDKQAFQTLVEEYQRLVAHIVFRLVSNASDREDLCQDVFVKVYQHLEGFRFESKFSTWIARIAYNVTLNYLQKKKVPLFDDHTPDEVSIEEVSGGAQRPDDWTEAKDRTQVLMTELENLDVHYRTIITLYHLDQMSYSEISEIMGIPEGTVKSYLFRARQQLKKRLMTKYKREELCSMTT